jgi:hypothetical protein
VPPRALIAAAIVVFLVIGSQFVLPRLAEREVESRLTESGGTAEVTLGAVPALRLLFSDGERFEIDAEGLDLDLDEEIDVFDRLDGFAIVGIEIDDSRAGPFELDSFSLTRDGSGPYAMTSTGHTSAAALADFGADTLGLPGGPFAGLALDALFGESGARIPVTLDMRIASSDGVAEVVDGDAEVAGLPAGPLAEIIASSIVARL